MGTRWSKGDWRIIGGAGVVLVAGVILRPWMPGAPAPRAPDGAPAQVAATATPAVSEQHKAEAVDLLAAAAARRAAGQLGPALELGDQALGKWPQYGEALQFVATVAPQATAAAGNAQAQATAAAQAALAQAQAGTAAHRAYSAKAQQPLQRYADALSGFNQSTREASQRPALLLDTTWRTRTAAGLVSMQAAADELTALGPVPQDMAAVAELFAQIAGETRLVGEDYARGIDDVDAVGASSMAAANARMSRIGALALRANVDVRRVVP